MARKDKMFAVSPFAAEGGRRGMDISLNDPLLDKTDVYGNRLKFIYEQGGALTPAQQDYYQRMQNQLPMYGGINQPSVSGDPSVTPFPIGCPTGFYQQGNVCIPVVGTFPGEDDFAPPAGQNFAKGQFYQVDAPTTTTAGQLFNTAAYFRNIGAIRGKFFIRWKIPDLGITDQLSAGVWVPQFSNGVIYKNLQMPANAPPGQRISATVELLHLDEASNQMTVDDVSTSSIPTPGTVPAPAPPPTTQDCYVVGGINYCLATTPTAGCIQILGRYYCPSGGTPTPPSGNAVLVLSPSGSVNDGNNITANGSNFGQYEVVDIVFEAITHSTSRPEWENKRYLLNTTSQTDYYGKFSKLLQAPTLASGVTANGTIKGTGRTSMKTVTQAINIV